MTARRSHFPLLWALRPKQWTKNGLLFVALAFTLNLHNVPLLVRAIGAFVCFCAISSAGYLLNDVVDVEGDRQHPSKRFRPIAAGQVTVRVATLTGLVLGAAGMAGAFALDEALGLLAVAYVALTVGYSLWLKHIVLVDVFCVGAGFVLRAAAGAVAIGVPISPWLYSATMLGALLIALGKRRSEIQLLGDGASGHRKNLESYSIGLIDQLIIVVSSAALMTYALYTFSAENLPRDHSMMLTIPLVLFGLFRYLYLVRSGKAGGAPEEMLFRDRPLLVSVIGWAVLSVGILYTHVN
jgi:4-hydroxybenzoate polyprenyltransferase